MRFYYANGDAGSNTSFSPLANGVITAVVFQCVDSNVIGLVRVSIGAPSKQEIGDNIVEAGTIFEGKSTDLTSVGDMNSVNMVLPMKHPVKTTDLIFIQGLAAGVSIGISIE